MSHLRLVREGDEPFAPGREVTYWCEAEQRVLYGAVLRITRYKVTVDFFAAGVRSISRDNLSIYYPPKKKV